MPEAQFLVDLSAWVRYSEPAVGARLDELSAAGLVATCGIIELHLLSVVPDKGTYATIASLRRASVVMLAMSEADVRRALEVQALLVERGQSGVPWPALLVMAVAERCGVTVLHAHSCFAVVSGVTRQSVERIHGVSPQ